MLKNCDGKPIDRCRDCSYVTTSVIFGNLCCHVDSFGHDGKISDLEAIAKWCPLEDWVKAEGADG